MNKAKVRRLTLAVLVIVASLAVILLIYYQRDAVGDLHEYLQNRVNPAVFLLLMLILPITGVPLSIFLLLVGIKFGILWGIVLSGVLMCFHMIFTYWLVHSFLRSWIIRFMNSVELSAYASRRTLNTWHLVIFMLIPGLPYAIKNNLLALSGIEFKRYLLINWSTQFPMSVPLVLAGAAVIEMNPLTLSIVFLLLVMVVFLQQYARKKFGESQAG